MRSYTLLPLVLAACGPSEAPTSTAEGAGALAIVYSSRLDGEIEPCG